MRRVYDVIRRHDLASRRYRGLKNLREKKDQASGRGAGRLAVPKACTETPTPPGQTLRRPIHYVRKNEVAVLLFDRNQ